MYHIKVEIEGVAPILFNRFTEEAENRLNKGVTGGRLTPKQRQEEALTKVYRNKDGLFLPAANIKKCLLEGALRARLKEGRASAVPYMRATVFIDGPEIPFRKDKPDFIDERLGRRPPRTGAAVIIRRPGLNVGWQLAFVLLVVDDRRDEQQLKVALEEAGLMSGLGDNRPEYGRFLIKKWEVSK